MKKFEWHKTAKEGVFYIEGTGPDGSPDRIYYLRYSSPDGKRHKEKAGRASKGMTLVKSVKIRARRMSGKEPSNKAQRAALEARKRAEAGRWTIDRLWQEYLTQRGAGLKGIITDRNRYEKHLKKPFGNKEPSAIAPLDIDRLRVGLAKKHAPATVHHCLELLRRIINFGIDRNLVAALNFRIKLPKVSNETTETLSDNELKKLLDAIENHPDLIAGQMMKFVLCTGLRKSELFRLSWQDIDSEKGFATIRDTKSGKDHIIPLNSQAKDLLNTIEKTKSPFVFPGRDGKQRVDIKRQIKIIREAAKLPKGFRPLHGLRHCFASGLVSQGVSLFVVSKLLCHASPQVTRRYSHLSNEALLDASELAGQIVADALKIEDNVIPLKK